MPKDGGGEMSQMTMAEMRFHLMQFKRGKGGKFFLKSLNEIKGSAFINGQCFMDIIDLGDETFDIFILEITDGVYQSFSNGIFIWCSSWLNEINNSKTFLAYWRTSLPTGAILPEDAKSLDLASLQGWDTPVVEDLNNDQIGPKPEGECKRITRIELCGSKSITNSGPPHGVTYIFVQGKESACIVSRNLGKEKMIYDLRFPLFGLTANRYYRDYVRGHTFKEPPDMDPFAVVSALLNTDDPSEEKESKPDSSSHKEDSSSRPVNEQAAINFLRQKLENNDTYEETIQTAISALQCLYQENVNADEIEGFTVEVGRIGRYLPREEIKSHLAVINNDSLALQKDMSSSWKGKDLRPNCRSVSSNEGAATPPGGHPLKDSPWWYPFYTRDSPWDEDVDIEGLIELPLKNYTPKPGGECKRTTVIKLSGSRTIKTPPQGFTFIFVQGKESACIVTRVLGKDKKINELEVDFIGLADVRLGRSAILGNAFERPTDMYPYAVVSAILNPDDLNEEKKSKLDSSHKDSSSRPVNEEAAIKFLKHKLENDSFKDTIQTAISALQCLHQENVKADEIEVFASLVGHTQKFLSREEIESHLTSSST